MNLKYVLLIVFYINTSCSQFRNTTDVGYVVEKGYNYFSISDYPVLVDPYNPIGARPHNVGMKIISDSFLIVYALWKGKRYKYMYGGDIKIDSLKYYSIMDTLFVGYVHKYLVRHINDSIYLLLNLNKTYMKRDSFYFVKKNSIKDKELVMDKLWFWMDD